MQDLDWDDLRYVLALARCGSRAAGARLLGVNETTVARRIAQLEARLGSKLFQRSGSALALTELGEQAVNRAERIEAEVAIIKVAANAKTSEVAGSVRVTSIPILLNRLLLPELRELYKAHPRLRIELVGEPRNLSLTKRDADLALRLARPHKEQRVVARRIAQVKYALYGPRGAKATTLPWIAYEDAMLDLPHAAWIHKTMRAEGSAASVTVNDSELALHAMKAGLGKSLLPMAMGDSEPGLSRLSGEASVLERELWLLVLPELKHLARVKAAIAWIEKVAKNRL